MIRNLGSIIILIALSVLISACSLVNANPEQTELPTPTPAPTQTPRPAPLPLPKDAFNIQAKDGTYSFETGAPIPSVAVFFKNQLLAQGCTLVSESGSSMEAIALIFVNCLDSESIQIAIFHNDNQGSAVTLTASP